MAKLVGRKPVELKITATQDNYIPIYDESTKAWTTIDKADIISGSAITSGSNVFVGNQSISGSLTVSESITGSLFGTAATASSADSFNVRNTLTAVAISASTSIITTNTQNGSFLNNNHQFTGSVFITGALEVNGRNYINDSSSFDNRIDEISGSLISLSEISIINSSSFNNRINAVSGSFSQFLEVYAIESGSVNENIRINSSSFVSFSGSYINESSSFSSRITTNSSNISSLSTNFNIFSGSYNTGSFTGSFTGSLLGIASNAISSSFAATASSADNLTVRGTLTAQTIIAQTITSSTEFITGSTKNGSLLSNTHEFTGSVDITGSLAVNGSDYTTTSGSASTRLTALETFSGVANTGSFTGSFVGSFSGSLNNLQNNVLGHIPFFSSSQVLADSVIRQLDNGTGSFSIAINQDNITTEAPEALFVYQPSSASYNVISGKGNLNNYLQLNIQNSNTGENASSDVVATANNGNEFINFINMGINSEGFTGSVGNENDAYLYSTGNHLHIGNASPNQPLGLFVGGDEVEINRKLVLRPNNKHEVTGSLDVSGGVTASLYGTASWAVNALNANTASFVQNAVSSSFASTASFVKNAQTASFVLNAISSSFATTASFALFVDGISNGTASIAATASFVQNAQTASFVLNAQTASFVQNAQTASFVLNAVSASFANTASYVENAQTASFVQTAQTASFVQTAQTASFVQNAQTASFVQTAQTASYVENAQTASFVLNAVSASFANTASFVQNAQTASYVENAQTASFVLNAISASHAATASSADNFTVRGTLTAQTIIAQTITSSTEFVTGSTRNGSLLTNTHEFTGSVLVTGSLQVNESSVILTNQTSSMSVATASFVQNAQTASFVLNAVSSSFTTLAVTALNANTASYVENAQTASFVQNAQTASYVENAQTASFVLNAISSSFATTASFVQNAQTASFVQNAQTASFVLNAVSASFATLAVTASNANTASYVENAQTASFILNAVSASYAANADLLDGKNSTIFATTGSNIFVGNQTITGTLQLNPAIDPGILNPSSSFLFSSASNTVTGHDLYYRQNDNLVKFNWLEGMLNTGILYGGILTFSSSYFHVSSGSGIILNHNATTGSEISPTITYVNWNASTHSIVNTGSQNTYVFIDANGSVQQQTLFFTTEQYHEVLPIGRVSHYGTASSIVTGVSNNMLPAYDVSQQLGEFTRAFGPLKTSGFTITPQVGNLSLDIGSGVAFHLGGFYQNTPEYPSSFNSNTYLTSSIIRIHRSGSEFQFDNNEGSYYTSVNPLLYDDGTGTLDTVGNDNWSIQRVFVNPVSGRSHVYYGQSIYTSYLNAVQSVATDDFIESEVTKNAYVFAGYLVMNGNTSNTDLSVGGTTNAIIQSGLFRNSVGGSGGAIAAISNLNDLSDVSITSPLNGQALIYSSGIFVNGTPVSASNAVSASFAQTASFVNGISNGTASFAVTSSFAQNAVSASFASTASSADNFIVRNNITSPNLRGYNSLFGTADSSITNFVVTVVSKTSNHRYFGVGSGLGYYIDGVEAPFITLLPGKTYRFLQDDASNSSHQILFYYDAAKTSQYLTNITVNGYAGSSGSYTQIVVTDTTPIVLHYQCINHGYMGNSAQFNSNVIDTPYQINTPSLRNYNSLFGTPSSEVITFNVLSVSKTSNHRYFNTGSAIGYHIDGVEAPFLTLLPGKTYRFLQDNGSNGSHQLNFYYQADKTTIYTTNVTHNGTAGQAGAYTQIVVTDTTPIVLHYQCINHGYMGNAAQFNSNVVDTPYQIIARNSINVTGSLIVNDSSVILTNQTSSMSVESASFSTTASFVQTAQTASFVQNAVSSSFAATSSFAQTAVSASFASTASFVQNAQTASFVQTAQTASFILNAISSSFASTASFVQNAQTASFVLNAVSASHAATASSADNFTVRGTLTAQTIVAQTITSSIEFVTGSTRNGSLLTNTHQFTGSISVTGSLVVNESSVILTNQTSSMSVATASFIQNAQTASFVQNAISASFATLAQTANTASFVILAQTASFVQNAVSASFATNATSASFALTASHISGSGGGVGFPFSGSAVITGSFFVSSSFVDFTQATFVTGSFTGSFSGTASNAVSSSFATSALTASSTPNAIVTASVNVSTITFVKGDNSTFNITVAQSGSVESAVFATTATSASHALNADTASFALTATSASHALNANTASFALNATSASFAFNSISSSFAQTASFASNSVSSSFAQTASIAFSSISSSFALNSNTASFAQTAVFALSAGDSPGATSTMTQSIAATTWSFTHNLNTRNPILQVYDSNHHQIVPFEIVGENASQAIIHFDTPESGFAIASNGGTLTVSGSTSRLDQINASATWSFQHNLATKYPNFIVYDSTDNVVIPAGIYAVNDMSAEIYFAFPTTGVAIAQFSGISGALNIATASFAHTASFGNNFIVGNTLTIDQTLTDYHTVASSIVGSNNMFNRATGSFSSAFFKYTVANGNNARSGEVMAVFAGGAIQFTDNSTLDIGDTSDVTAAVAIAGSSVQFNLTTATSGWRLKSLATFM